MKIRRSGYFKLSRIIAVGCVALVLFPRLASAQEFITGWGSEGSGNGQFYEPNDIAVDADGNVYVADKENHRIQKFTSEGYFLTEWSGEGSNVRPFEPSNIAVDAVGNVYVVDARNNRIQKFTSEGQFLAKWGEIHGSGDGQFEYPTSIAVDTGGNVYVGDHFNHRIQKFTSDGQFLTKWGSSGSGDGQFNQPEGIAVDTNGNVYVGDHFNHRIQKFTSDGQFLAKWGSFGSGDGQFVYLNDVAVDAVGNVYVADTENHRIQKFTSEGQFLIKWGSEGSGDGQFIYPYGITVGAGGNVYVADTKNHRIQVFRSDSPVVPIQQGQFQFSPSTHTTSETSGTVTITVTRTSGSDGQVTVNYATDNGTAIAGSDYTATSGTLTFAAGETSKTFNIPITNDTEVEGDETVTLTLSNPTGGATLGNPGTAVLTIQDDDQPVTPGELIPPANLRGTSGQGAITLSWDSVGGAAVAGYNVYVAASEKGPWSKHNTTGLVKETIYRDNDVRLENGKTYYYYVTTADQSGKESVPSDIVFVPYISFAFINKAIIVLGSTPDDSVWKEFRMCTDQAYRAFMRQEFNLKTIRYLAADPTLDPDGDGILGHVDGEATKKNLEDALQWAKDAENVILYIADHGGDGTFKINPMEILSAPDLDQWLDELQQLPIRVIFIYEACKSGSFLAHLKPPAGRERIVITSTSPKEDAIFETGPVSFSTFFWNNIENGATVLEAFNNGKRGITGHQTPLLDGDADGTPGQKSDQQIAGDLRIGSGKSFGSDAPQIESAMASPDVLNGDSSATLWARNVITTGTIARVWALILPPNHQTGSSSEPVTDLPVVELELVDNNHYRGSYDGFTAAGTYEISVYAADIQGNISMPARTTLTQGADSAIIMVDSDAPEVNISFVPGQMVHLTFKAEQGQKIWILVEVPTIFPGIRFARPYDAYCQQQGRYVFLLTNISYDFYYLSSSPGDRIDFGTNNFTGLGELIITIKKGESPASLQTIQTIRLTEQK